MWWVFPPAGVNVSRRSVESGFRHALNKALLARFRVKSPGQLRHLVRPRWARGGIRAENWPAFSVSGGRVHCGKGLRGAQSYLWNGPLPQIPLLKSSSGMLTRTPSLRGTEALDPFSIRADCWRGSLGPFARDLDVYGGSSFLGGLRAIPATYEIGWYSLRDGWDYWDGERCTRVRTDTCQFHHCLEHV